MRPELIRATCSQCGDPVVVDTMRVPVWQNSNGAVLTTCKDCGWRGALSAAPYGRSTVGETVPRTDFERRRR